MNQYNAARAAGYSEATSRHHVDRLEKVAKGDIRDALEQAGLTDKYRAEELIKLTQATRIQNVNIVLKRTTDNKLEVQDTDDFIEVPDHNVRLNAHKHISELMGNVKSKLEVSGHIAVVTMKSIEIIREVDKKPVNKMAEYNIGEAIDSGNLADAGQTDSNNRTG